jgi:arylsulfatase A-like enzyme
MRTWFDSQLTKRIMSGIGGATRSWSTLKNKRTVIAPVTLSLLLWSLGSGSVLRHVLMTDSFVMAEVRRHGLVPKLVFTLLAFSVPYLVVGIASAAVAAGIVRLVSRGESRPAWRGAILGSALVVGFLGWSTLYALAERPALLAGLFYLRGGIWRKAQLMLEGSVTPSRLAWWGLLLLGLMIAASAAGWWRGMTARWRGGALAVAAIVALGIVASWGTRTSQADRGPNLLLILVDSLRPDVVDSQSAASAAMPFLNRFAVESVRFRSARTPLARTYPSVASLMTGRHPAVHGVRTHYPDRAARRLSVPDLPDLMREEGWATAAVGGYCATVFRELEFGFQEHRTPRSEADLVVSAAALAGHPLLPVWVRYPWARRLLPQVRTAIDGSHPADVAREAVAAWRSSHTPFLLTVFFDNAHLPYVSVWPDSTGAGDYAGPNRYSVTAGNLEELIRAGETAEVQRTYDAELANVRRLYLSALRSVDRAIESLLGELERDGLADDTVVMILADHGQNLLDDEGPLSHGEAVERDQSTTIPWLIRWPDRLAPLVVDEPVSVMDLVPTVIDILRIGVEGTYDGISLLPRIHGASRLPERPMWFETGMWFVASETVARLDPSGRGLAYPDFDDGLLGVESGDPIHIVIAPEHRDALYRAKQRRLELGPWALTYLPRLEGAAFRLYRHDLDPGLTQDLAAQEPEKLEELVVFFYEYGERLGEKHLLRPESEPLRSLVSGFTGTD